MVFVYYYLHILNHTNFHLRFYQKLLSFNFRNPNNFHTRQLIHHLIMIFINYLYIFIILHFEILFVIFLFIHLINLNYKLSYINITIILY